MKPRELKPRELVQLNPHTVRNVMFGGCVMVVTEPKPWGAQGYVQALGEDGKIGGQAYYRPVWDEMEETGGFAPWDVKHGEEGE